MISIVNFRDMGGVKGKNGFTVRKKRLLRSGEVVELTPEDQSALKEIFQLKKIVDFRQYAEVSERPDIKLAEVDYYHIDVMKDAEEFAASLESFIAHLNEKDVDAMMQRMYQDLIVNPVPQAGFKQFIELLLDQTSGATLFHCFAGKDRTGLAAAIVYKLLGVSEKDILKDYMQTNEDRFEANERIVFEAAKKGMPQLQQNALRRMMCVDESYLQAAFAAVDSQYATFENYAEKALQITKPEIDTLQDLYLEK
ncbi:tyrosine-protein phosphatase [Bacillaceae bacterium Marseille-Q3522]|nr:tyrosine-protein phosphatase [Bacillaceae bacterium Marseille-Q3522]